MSSASPDRVGPGVGSGLGATRLPPRSGSVRYEVPVLRALLVTIAAVLALVWLRYHGLPQPFFGGMRWPDAAWITSGGLVLWGGAIVAERTREARWIATAGVALAGALLAMDLWLRPEAAYVPLVAAAALVARIWPRTWRLDPDPALDARISAAYEARASALVAFGAWMVAVPAEWTARRSGAGALGLVMLVAGVFALRWAILDRRAGLQHWVWAAVGAAAAWGTAALQWRSSPLLATVPLVIAPIATWIAAAPAGRRTGPAEGLAAAMVENPARFLWASFAMLSMWGAAVLGLPVCAGTRARIPFLDALFTAVSASCTAGLTVRDPGDFSAVGHLVILVLVQLGGLGIMAFSAATLSILGRRQGGWSARFRADPRAAAIIPEPATNVREGVWAALRRVVVVTFAVEALGALVLTYLFRMEGEPMATAAWRGIFLSVSAFCNGGYTLMGYGLAPWRDQPLVLHTIATLVILGSLGPAVIAALPIWIRTRRASVGVRLTVWTTAFLLVTSAVLIALFEAQHSMAKLGFWPWLHNSWLLSASARSAGYTATNLLELHPASMALILGLMFVGGAPGSTAGGVKTTTFALLGLAVLASIRGDSVPSAFGRRFPAATIYRAFTVATFALLTIFPALTAILVTQDIPFEVALFEVTSALGTAGFTLGASQRMDEIGKVVLAACMFLGRVGPLTIFLLLSQGRSEKRAGLPEQDVPVG